MATALKRSVYTRSSGAGVPPTREAPDPALQRFLDAVWMERGLSANTLGRVSRRSDRAGALARRARQRAAQSHAHRALGIHRSARRGRIASPFDCAPVVELSTLLSIHGARGPDHGRPHGADRDAEDRPLAAEVADRGGSRCACSRRRPCHRSSGSSRPHHARGPVCHGIARLGAREPEAQSGQCEPGRDARGRQGQPRAA
jgi:hypothetical protein